MINLYYLNPLSPKRWLRLVLLAFSPGVITILCHAETIFSPVHFSDILKVYADARSYSEVYAHEHVILSENYRSVTDPVIFRGPPPRAENDFGTTPEEIPITIDVLSNDRSGTRDDDDDDDDGDGDNGDGNGGNDDDDDDGDDGDDDNDNDDNDNEEENNDEDSFQIDRSSVDLNPEDSGIQSSLSTDQGSYTVDGNGLLTFVPALNFFGSTRIQYTVNSQADETSNRAEVQVTVTNVNDAPVITGQGNGSLNGEAGQPITITLGDVIVTDPDNETGDLMLTVLPGDNYTVSGNAVTPHADYSGVLPVQVQVGDGEALSEAFVLNVNVTQENVAPVISGQKSLSTPEDQAVTISADHLEVTDPDDTYPTGFTINLGAGANYSVSGQIVTPAQNFSGELTVPVTVNDGESDSGPFSFTITVTPVNDPPIITGQTPNPLTTPENQPLAITLGHLVVTDPDNTFPGDFTHTVLAGENYSVSENTITPAAGYSGPLTVNVTANDPAVSSAPFPLSVSVIANSPPVISGHTPLSTNEETPLTITLADLQVTDQDNTYPTGFTFRLSPGANYTVSGNVITPATNFTGNLSVPVIVNDGINDSEPFNLAIAVQNVNDPPVITGQVPLTIPENETITLDRSDLTVADPDNEYPGNFTLSILAGTNYTVSGTQVTPSAGFNGILTVPVFVNDGGTNSNTFDLNITVTPRNDPPRITGQRAIEINEGASVGIALQDLTVTDPDNTYPSGFSLTIQPGENYTFSGTTVTPEADFTGTLLVNVIVNDGMSNSEPFPLNILVTPVNDPPRITGQQAVSTNEDVSRTIALTDLVVSDPDNAYPAGFTLAVFPGPNYTLNGTTVVPVANYNGALTVQVQISDGVVTSNIFDLSVTVVAVNDPPVITGQVPVQTGEDEPVTLQLSHLTVLDVDNSYPAGFTLQVSPGSNYTVSGSTITPATDFNGTLNVNVAVNDGTSTSNTFLFQIQVGDANDAPVITGQSPLNTNEETPVTLELSHLTVADPDNAFPTGFSLLVSAGANYTVTDRTVTPAVNFSGVLTIPVRVNDGINNSATFNFQLQVNAINDAPAFAAIPNQQITENAPAASINITGISKGPGEPDQQLTFVATSNNTAIIENPVIQYNGGSSAVLSYAVKPDMSGVVTITIVAIDNGLNTPPHQNSYSSSFQIEVLPINNAPTLDAINDITLMEDAEQQNVTLTGISAGPGEAQTLSVSVQADKPEFFDLLQIAYTSPEITGLLHFKTKANVFGTVKITVEVADSGSGISPHKNTIAQTFSVIIQPVNDLPVFTSEPVTLAVINENYEYRITGTDPDGQKISISAPVKPSWATLTESGNGVAILRGRPPASALGNNEVKLEVEDESATVEQPFTIYVNVRPSVTSLSMITEEDTRVSFPASFFDSGYTDLNENPLAGIQITKLPAAGALVLADAAVQEGDTIIAALMTQLSYTPNGNYYGPDTIEWKAFDAYHFSLNTARVDISVLPINDPPVIVLQADTLQYEVNGEPVFLDPFAEITDADDDTLTQASVGFHPQNYHPETDMIEFRNTPNIRGNFDYQTGVLQLSGTAPIDEYQTAIRGIRYWYANTFDPILEPKKVFYTTNDGENESEPRDLVILLQYTFIEFEIPSGFTPNGDQANDTWVIQRPGGGLEEMDNAIITVYNRKGVLVYRARGFERPWDGTMNGELLPADTYFFTIDLQLRNKKTYKGIVTILR